MLLFPTAKQSANSTTTEYIKHTVECIKLYHYYTKIVKRMLLFRQDDFLNLNFS